jgi:hypothetical protein
MSVPAGHRLDAEWRDRVRRCLTKERISLPQDRFEQLIRDIEASIDRFGMDASDKGTFREAHDALRAFSERCRLCKPPVRVLREELQRLPKEAIEYIARRARAVIPRLFPGKTIGADVFDPTDRLVARFLIWAAAADDKKLVQALRALSVEGGGSVAGRSRGGGKRSRARFEPMIMSEVRGAGAWDHRGGAPTNDAGHRLVMHFALDWLHATGHTPKPRRSDYTGFGDLVHSVFQWLDNSGAPSKTAAYALRRYWTTLKRRKRSAAPFTVVCADCRWVRPGATRDEFFCEKLAIACGRARDDGQECGPEGLLFEQAV